MNEINARLLQALIAVGYFTLAIAVCAGLMKFFGKYLALNGFTKSIKFWHIPHMIIWPFAINILSILSKVTEFLSIASVVIWHILENVIASVEYNSLLSFSSNETCSSIISSYPSLT